jgi:outer membrane biosynthesis protein TonB
MIRFRFLPALAVTAVLGVAACGPQGSAPVDDELKRDLDMAEAAAVQIAPAAPRTQVVSAIEGGETPEKAPEPKATPRPSPRPTVARKAPTPRRAPTPVQVAEAPEPAPAPVPEPTPEPTPAPVEVREPVTAAPTPAPSREPAPAPRQIPAPRGRSGRGTWTTADVIRNAPFPILP